VESHPKVEKHDVRMGPGRDVNVGRRIPTFGKILARRALKNSVKSREAGPESKEVRSPRVM